MYEPCDCIQIPIFNYFARLLLDLQFDVVIVPFFDNRLCTFAPNALQSYSLMSFVPVHNVTVTAVMNFVLTCWTEQVWVSSKQH